MTPRGTVPRAAAMVALGVALALAGCSPRMPATTGTPTKAATAREASATAEASAPISASDAALLAAVEGRFDDAATALVPKAEKRVAALERLLGDAPLVVESTITPPGVWAVGDAVSTVTPKGNPRRTDKLEPDNSPSQAVVLRKGQSVTRTTHGAGPHDWSDWTGFVDTEGPGFYYVVASTYLQTQTFGGTDETVLKSGLRGTVILGTVPGTEHPTPGRYPWLQVKTHEGWEAKYRVSYVASAPVNLVGEECSRDVATGFYWGGGAAEYAHITGRRATARDLSTLSDALVDKRMSQDASAGQWADVPWWFVVSSPHDPTLLRAFCWLRGRPEPRVFWLRLAKLDGRWIIVGLGKDASWHSSRYAVAFEVYRRLGYRTLVHYGSRKPAIYLYPSREQSVTVRVDYRGVVTSTAPVIDSATKGWTVSAKPDGTITDRAGRRWPYLFWEGMGAPAWDLSTGSVVQGAKVDAFLRRTLAERGLNAAESAAFREYWVPILSANPWVLIHFEGATYERYAPLSVSPQPDTMLRVFMVAQPLEQPVHVRPQRLPAPPTRRGFTLVEWGGALAPGGGQ